MGKGSFSVVCTLLRISLSVLSRWELHVGSLGIEGSGTMLPFERGVGIFGEAYRTADFCFGRGAYVRRAYTWAAYGFVRLNQVCS